MYYNFDETAKMLLINNFQTWKKDQHGEGDALWRTGIAYITNPLKKYKDGILQAFKLKDDGKYQARRCNPDIGVDDVSRDQVILAWTSLFINNDIKELDELVSHTPYRLSKRYLMTPTMWLWSRGIIGKKFLGHIGQFFLSIELTFSILLNILIKKLIGYEELSLDEIDFLMSETDDDGNKIGENIRHECLTSKWKKLLWKSNFPGYGLHLAAWMNYTGPQSIFKTFNNHLINIDMSKYNLLLKLLIGKTVIEEEIEDFKPHEEWIWSQRNTKMNRNQRLPEKEDYAFDKEILRTIKKRNKE